MKSSPSRRPFLTAFAALALAALGGTSVAHAQARYPDKPVRMVVGFAAGGPTDVVARKFAARLGTLLGQSVVVENKPGAGTTMATAEVVRSRPDGYTVYFTGSAALTITPLSIPGLTYDVSRDLTPVTLVAAERFAIGVHPSVNARSLKELAQVAQANKGKISFASSGTGNIGHLTGELFNQLAGTDMTHIPYKGAAPALQDLLAGHVGVLASGLGTMYEQHRQGKLRVLAVTDRERSTLAPEIPTVADAGYPGLLATSVFVLLVPSGVPAPVFSALDTASRSVLASPEFAADVKAAALEPVRDVGPHHAREFIDGELKRWADLVRTNNIKMN